MIKICDSKLSVKLMLLTGVKVPNRTVRQTFHRFMYSFFKGCLDGDYLKFGALNPARKPI